MSVHDTQFIGGRWIRATGDQVLEVTSPITEQVFGRVPVPTPSEIDAAVAAARDAFDRGPWPRLSVAERADHLRRMMDAFDSRVEAAIVLQTDEMGAAETFTGATTRAMRPFLERVIADAAHVPMVETRQGTAGLVRVLREPLGVAAAVVPWNAPLMVAVTKIFPALLMGCPMVLKTAPESPLSAYLLAEAFDEAGLPPGVLSILGGGREVGEYLVAHPGVDKVTFTGSTVAGRAIASVCGQQLKPVTCELGGKSAAILAPGVDIGAHLGTLVANSLGNAGQMCIATTRLLVHESQADDLRDGLADRLAGMKVGDPHEKDTAFGPLVSARQLERVRGYIDSGIAQGAKLAYGGERPPGLPVGFYVMPTIFTGVTNDMTIAREEIFGPVLSVIGYRTEDEAVDIANDSEYGLGGSVYADDPEHAFALASRLQTGTCTINDSPTSGGGGPFGGYKNSGLGRERAPEGLHHYLQLKSIALPASYTPAG
ncbi:MAG TPA: aldehyde dehydrogenase family protein [Pseudonocardia sp.]|nr:aldehyde dehydrogenase family protein [Pseudonocardia sp.]